MVIALTLRLRLKRYRTEANRSPSTAVLHCGSHLSAMSLSLLQPDRAQFGAAGAVRGSGVGRKIGQGHDKPLKSFIHSIVPYIRYRRMIYRF
jgi:hypothetical protein